MESSRRNFLKLSGLALVANSAGAVPMFSDSMASPTPGQISVRVTNDKLQYSAANPVIWKPGSTGILQNTIVLDAEKKNQEILGFGAALTEASCYMFNQLAPKSATSYFKSYFILRG